MIIWYFTSKNWWNKALLFPIAMLIFQIIILLDDDIEFKDDARLDKFVIIPVAFGISTLLIIIKNKLSFYSQGLDLKDQIDNEINLLKSQIEDAGRD